MFHLSNMAMEMAAAIWGFKVWVDKATIHRAIISNQLSFHVFSFLYIQKYILGEPLPFHLYIFILSVDNS